MKISNNFTLAELCNSNVAKNKGLDNCPNDIQINNLRVLVLSLLQPLRDVWGKTMHVNSGFRSVEVNKVVGGVSNSQHLEGKAADIRVDNARELLQTLIHSALEWDQAILYDDGKSHFLHLSYNDVCNRKQVLYSKNTRP